jgi:hypothetical protein
MSYSVSIPQLPEVANDVAKSRISYCRAPHISADSPIQIQDITSAERETKGRKCSFAYHEGTTEIEVAQAMVRETAILLEHTAIAYGGDGGAPVYFVRGMKALKDELKEDLKAGLKDLKDAMIARYFQDNSVGTFYVIEIELDSLLLLEKAGMSRECQMQRINKTVSFSRHCLRMVETLPNIFQLQLPSSGSWQVNAAPMPVTPYSPPH